MWLVVRESYIGLLAERDAELEKEQKGFALAIGGGVVERGPAELELRETGTKSLSLRETPLECKQAMI